MRLLELMDDLRHAYGGKVIVTGTLPDVLPASALLRGWRLVSVRPTGCGGDPDVVIVDRERNVLHAWPQDYMPSLTDIMELCRALEVGR